MNSEDVKIYNFLKKIKLITVMKFFMTLTRSGIRGIKRKIKLRHAPEEEKYEIIRYDFKKGRNLGELIKDNKKPSIDVIIEKNISQEEVLNCFKSYPVDVNLMVMTRKQTKNLQDNEINNFQLKKLFTDRAFLLISKKKYKLDHFYFVKQIRSIDTLKDEVSKLFTDVENFKYFANYNKKDCVSVKCHTFFDFKGSNYFSGGAERYLIDLYEILKKKGINLDIYQDAEIPFMRKYNGINVIGMANDGVVGYSNEFKDSQSKHYINLTYGKSQLHIYSSFFECFPNCVSPSIGISHGIGWDDPSNKYLDAISFWMGKEAIIESAKQCDTLISVDTNTANWFQTIDYKIGNEKFSVIPNYVDVEEFSPRKDYTNPGKKIVIVYPRRLYKPRGMYIALEAAEKIVKKYNNVEFHFVGKGFKKETDDIDALCKKYPKKVFRYSKSPFEMHNVYKEADISLIPTLYSEGTSLSCLEAMASGNLVVSTRIGGLSDLIINGYNGYLIEPNSEALYDTLEHVIENYKDQMIIKERAVEVAKAFNKKIWISKWEKEFDKYKLNKKSDNIGLVEFYVKDIMNINDKIKEEIKKNIMEKKLVYIRSEKKPETDTISSGLIQLIDFNDEVVNKAEKVFVEKGLKEKIKREEKIIVM